MNKIESEVEYFLKLFDKNMRIVKEKKLNNMSKEEMIFFNFNISLNGKELIVYNQEEDLIYYIRINQIQETNFKKIDKEYILNLIKLLEKYLKREITINKLIYLYNNIK